MNGDLRMMKLNKCYLCGENDSRIIYKGTRGVHSYKCIKMQ